LRCRAPSLHGAKHDLDPTRLHSLDGDEFWQAFELRYGANPHLVKGSPMRKIVEPALRADFHMVETYQQQVSRPAGGCAGAG
jgi:surfactin synthase thioesterase subunit